MFDEKSRYARLATAAHTTPDGREIQYVLRRFLPRGESMPTLAEVSVQAGDRLDLIAARTLGDPLKSWLVADANDAMDPLELTETIDRTLKIPIPQAGR